MKPEEIIPATRKLELTGMTRAQAETVVCVVREAVAPLATKADVETLGKSIRSEMADFKQSMQEDMTSFKESIREDMTKFTESMQEDMTSFKQSMQEEMAKFTGSMREDMTNFKESMQEDMGNFKDSSKLSIASQLAGMESRLFWKLTAVMIAIGTFIASFT